MSAFLLALLLSPGLLHAEVASPFQAAGPSEGRASGKNNAQAQDTARAPDRLTTRGIVWERHQVDVEASDLYVVTHKSGLLSFLGHEHAIIPMEWSGELCVPEPMQPGAWGSILIQTPSLVIDSDSARNLAGLGEGPGEDDVEEIQRTLLEGENLAAETHPEIRVESRVQGLREEEGRLVLHTRLTLKGRTREFEHPVRTGGAAGGQAPGGPLEVQGTVTVRQTDFGIEPASVAGVVNVSDEVDLHFTLVTNPTGGSCEPGGPGRENGG